MKNLKEQFRDDFQNQLEYQLSTDELRYPIEALWQRIYLEFVDQLWYRLIDLWKGEGN